MYQHYSPSSPSTSSVSSSATQQFAMPPMQAGYYNAAGQFVAPHHLHESSHVHSPQRRDSPLLRIIEGPAPSIHIQRDGQTYQSSERMVRVVRSLNNNVYRIDASVNIIPKPICDSTLSIV
jgi:hypothetical protein